MLTNDYVFEIYPAERNPLRYDHYIDVKLDGPSPVPAEKRISELEKILAELLKKEAAQMAEIHLKVKMLRHPDAIDYKRSIRIHLGSDLDTNEIVAAIESIHLRGMDANVRCVLLR